VSRSSFEAAFAFGDGGSRLVYTCKGPVEHTAPATRIHFKSEPTNVHCTHMARSVSLRPEMGVVFRLSLECTRCDLNSNGPDRLEAALKRRILSRCLFPVKCCDRKAMLVSAFHSYSSNSLPLKRHRRTEFPFPTALR
jgi:hypothetical protein